MEGKQKVGRRRNELFWLLFKISGLKSPVHFRRIIRQLEGMKDKGL